MTDRVGDRVGLAVLVEEGSGEPNTLSDQDWPTGGVVHVRDRVDARRPLGEYSAR